MVHLRELSVEEKHLQTRSALEDTLVCEQVFILKNVIVRDRLGVLLIFSFLFCLTRTRQFLCCETTIVYCS